MIKFMIKFKFTTITMMILMIISDIAESGREKQVRPTCLCLSE